MYRRTVKLAYVHVGDFSGEGWHAKLRRPFYEGVFLAGAGFTRDLEKHCSKREVQMRLSMHQAPG